LQLEIDKTGLLKCIAYYKYAHLVYLDVKYKFKSKVLCGNPKTTCHMKKYMRHKVFHLTRSYYFSIKYFNINNIFQYKQSTWPN